MEVEDCPCLYRIGVVAAGSVCKEKADMCHILLSKWRQGGSREQNQKYEMIPLKLLGVGTLYAAFMQDQ